MSQLFTRENKAWAFYQKCLGGGGGGALPFRIGRVACPTFLGPKILSGPIFLHLVFCLFKFIFLGSHLAENLYFWINLAYNKEGLTEKILDGRFSRSFCLPYRNVEHWKMSNLYFLVSFEPILP